MFRLAVLFGTDAERRVREAAARARRLSRHMALSRAVPSRAPRPPHRRLQLQPRAARAPHRQLTREARSASGIALLTTNY